MSRAPPGRPSPVLTDTLEARRLLATVILCRHWDLRFEALLRTGGVAKWYSAVGNEATTVGATSLLERGDALVTLHRDVGALLARFVDVESLLPGVFHRGPRRPDAGRRRAARSYLDRLAEQVIGRGDGFTGGLDRSYHFGLIDEADGKIHVGMVSPLGAMVPVAAGLALALARRGGGRVALHFLGEGATSTGDFHEGLNMAAVWRLPLVLVVENNGYAFSTPVREQYACRSLADRAPGYGVAGAVVDGSDIDAVRAVTADAIERARRGDGPTLIEAIVGRLRGHSEGDRSLDLVPLEDRERFREADPLQRLERRLLEAGLVDDDFLGRAHDASRRLLIDVTDQALAAPLPEPGRVLRDRTVFAPLDAAGDPAPTRDVELDPEPPAQSTYLEAIRRALIEEMDRDPAVVLLGQDIAEFGGAFRVTEGLLERFGPDRVRNTPIAESGAIGIAVGAALLGLRTVVEMQFADFIACGFNQVVNVAAKMHFRWGARVPIVIRAPYGAGGGAGPFHSQSPEAWFTHVPGLKVVAPAYPADALGLLRSAIRDPNPVLFFEHKHLYRRIRELLPATEHLVPLGRARIVRRGEDATVITYGWMVHRAVEAAEALERDGLRVEVVDLRSLVPLDEGTVLESVRRTSRVLLVHEAPITGGFGAELAARIADVGFMDLDAPIRRIGFPDIPIPYHPALEAACLPDVPRIAEALRRLVAE